MAPLRKTSLQDNEHDVQQTSLICDEVCTDIVVSAVMLLLSMLSVSEKLLSRIEQSDHVALGCDSGIVYVSRQALPLAMYARSTMNYTLIATAIDLILHFDFCVCRFMVFLILLFLGPAHAQDILGVNSTATPTQVEEFPRFNPHMCRTIFDTTRQIDYVCGRHRDLFPVLLMAERIAKEECESRFKNEVWNCSGFSLLKQPNISRRGKFTHYLVHVRFSIVPVV